MEDYKTLKSSLIVYKKQFCITKPQFLKHVNNIMKSLKYIITKEGKFYVSRCLNVEVSSFGKTIDEAKSNLKEALDLYFEDNNERFDLQIITETIIGEMKIKVL